MNLAGLGSCHLYDIHRNNYHVLSLGGIGTRQTAVLRSRGKPEESAKGDEGERGGGEREQTATGSSVRKHVAIKCSYYENTKIKEKKNTNARITGVHPARAPRPPELRRGRGGNITLLPNVDLEHLCKFVRGICNTLGRHFDKPLRFTFYSRARDPEVDESLTASVSPRTGQAEKDPETNDSYKTLGIRGKAHSKCIGKER